MLAVLGAVALLHVSGGMGSADAAGKRVRARIDGRTFELLIPNRPPRGYKPGKLGADLKSLLTAIETQFGKKPLVTSGCRTPERNRAVGGAPRSYHLTCSAADIVIPGVAKEAIRAYALSLPGRGGVGTYCHLDIVHIDSGPRREWHWPCGFRPSYQAKQDAARTQE